jgi:hypothetical protein
VKPLWKIALTIAACIALVCGTAIAWHVHKAKAHERMLAETARVTLLRAQQGDAKSQFDLGHMYFHGEGVPQDYTKAAHWYRLSADQGNAAAQSGIGYMYHNGKGVPQNDAEALRWNLLSAKQGDAKAQNNIGTMYYYGQGVTQDYAESLRWYRKAADQGDAMAEGGIAYIYLYGHGVTQDDAEALRWFRKAADQGYARAQYELGLSYYYGQGVPVNRAEARRWFRKAAAQGDTYALSAISEQLTTCTKFALLTGLLGGLLLTFSFIPTNFLETGKSLREPRQQLVTATGVLCLFTVGLSWYGYTHNKIRCLMCGINTFTAFKWLLDAAMVALVIYILRSGNKPDASQYEIESSHIDPASEDINPEP